MRDYYTREEWTGSLSSLKKRIESASDSPEFLYLDLGGVRKVRLALFAREARDLIQRELKWVLTVICLVPLFCRLCHQRPDGRQEVSGLW